MAAVLCWSGRNRNKPTRGRNQAATAHGPEAGITGLCQRTDPCEREPGGARSCWRAGRRPGQTKPTRNRLEDHRRPGGVAKRWRRWTVGGASQRNNPIEAAGLLRIGTERAAKHDAVVISHGTTYRNDDTDPKAAHRSRSEAYRSDRGRGDGLRKWGQHLGRNRSSFCAGLNGSVETKQK